MEHDGYTADDEVTDIGLVQGGQDFEYLATHERILALPHG